MRVTLTLTHLLPLMLLLNPILAAESEDPTSAVTKPAASTAAPRSSVAHASSSAGGKKEASATDEASASATADPSGTGKDSKASSSNKDESAKPTQTQTLETETFDSSPPQTLAPDLNAGAFAVRDSGFMGLGVAFGAVAVGINYL